MDTTVEVTSDSPVSHRNSQSGCVAVQFVAEESTAKPFLWTV